MMKRIIWHWSAGSHKASAEDRKHYHFIIEGDGAIVPGTHPPEDNEDISDGVYAAHTLNANTGAIGVAVAAMRDAMEHPFSAGPSPITTKQVEALVALTARLCTQYSIPVSRETMLSHAEVPLILKVPQRGKWDITWLPGMRSTAPAVEIGDRLRALVRLALAGETRPAPEKMPMPSPAVGIAAVLAALVAGIAAWFGSLEAWIRHLTGG